MSNKKLLAEIEEHVGELMQCEDAWHQEVLQLRQMIVRYREALTLVQQAIVELLPNQDGRVLDLAELIESPLPWQE